MKIKWIVGYIVFVCCFALMFTTLGDFIIWGPPIVNKQIPVLRAELRGSTKSSVLGIIDTPHGDFQRHHAGILYRFIFNENKPDRSVLIPIWSPLNKELNLKFKELHADENNYTNSILN